MALYMQHNQHNYISMESKFSEHICFECSFYEDIRNTFFHTVENLHSEFNTLNYENRFKLLMSIDVVKLTANFVYKIYKKRRDFIYN